MFTSQLRLRVGLLVFFAAVSMVSLSPAHADSPLPPIKTVFMILLENHNWSQIAGNPSAKYINQTLLPMASYATQYFNPPKLHPSEPNYIWLEAGSNFGVRSDLDASTNHIASTDHLVTLLNNAGISWKLYQEGIKGDSCPIQDHGGYVAKHNPMIFFEDVTDHNNPKSTYCINHMRPYSELAADLTNSTIARYNFLTPNECDDMHNQYGCATQDSVLNGDRWLAKEVPNLLASQAYQDGGAIFITWDEGEGSDGPIGMIVLSQFAKGNGYTSSIPYTHSSTLRTVQEIFGVTPLLGDAANANDLSDLFVSPASATPAATPNS